MKFEPPVNSNYAAVVVKVRSLVSLAGRDNIVGMPMLGYQAIVGKDTPVGSLGVLFTAETQLSQEYCYENSLHRHTDQNKDPNAKGYLEDNRRVRAIKFGGHRSDALFMPLSSLAYTGARDEDFHEGDCFDRINGHDVCKKYVVYRRGSGRQNAAQEKRQQRVELRFMPEHFDSENFFRVSSSLDPSTKVIITQKLHGTSIRIGNVPVARKIRLVERLAKLFGAKIQTHEFMPAYGSRKVIKGVGDEESEGNHYYDANLWTLHGKRLDGIVPQGYVVYGELIGYTPDGAAIQKHYTYDQGMGSAELFVYRVSYVNPQGVAADLSWDGVREFCGVNGLMHVRELFRSTVHDLTYTGSTGPLIDAYMDVNFAEWRDRHDAAHGDSAPLFRDKPVKLSDDSPCDEGICIRTEGIIPRIWKAKSPKFLAHETKMLDAGVEDVESTQTEATEEVSDDSSMSQL